MLKVPGQVGGCNPEPRGRDGHLPPALQRERRRRAGGGSCRCTPAQRFGVDGQRSVLIISVFSVK